MNHPNNHITNALLVRDHSDHVAGSCSNFAIIELQGIPCIIWSGRREDKGVLKFFSRTNTVNWLKCQGEFQLEISKFLFILKFLLTLINKTFIFSHVDKLIF